MRARQAQWFKATSLNFIKLFPCCIYPILNVTLLDGRFFLSLSFVWYQCDCNSQQMSCVFHTYGLYGFLVSVDCKNLIYSEQFFVVVFYFLGGCTLSLACKPSSAYDYYKNGCLYCVFESNRFAAKFRFNGHILQLCWWWWSCCWVHTLRKCMYKCTYAAHTHNRFVRHTHIAQQTIYIIEECYFKKCHRLILYVRVLCTSHCILCTVHTLELFGCCLFNIMDNNTQCPL